MHSLHKIISIDQKTSLYDEGLDDHYMFFRKDLVLSESETAALGSAGKSALLLYRDTELPADAFIHLACSTAHEFFLVLVVCELAPHIEHRAVSDDKIETFTSFSLSCF